MKSRLQQIQQQGRQYVAALRRIFREKLVRYGKPSVRTPFEKPWWRYDISELLTAFRQIQTGNGFLSALSNLQDIEQWSGTVRICILGVCSATALGLTGLLFWPVQMSAHQALDSERLLLESRYLRQGQIIDEAPYYQLQVDGIWKQFGSLLDAVPETLEPVHVLNLINQAAKASGVRLEGFKPLSEETETYYVVLPVEIRLVGDFHGLARFMEQISRMRHLVTVDVVIVPSATQQEQLVLASLLKAYRYNDPGKLME